MGEIRTILADDHQVVLDGLLSVLEDETDIKVLGTARSGKEVELLLKAETPEVLVLDYSFRDQKDDSPQSGLEIAQILLKKYPDLNILMLTMHDGSDKIVKCIEAGVQGYMLKSEPDFDIARAIREIAKNGHYFSPEISTQLAINIIQYKQNRIELTKREQEVLEALFRGNSTSEIAELLFISNNTVETHRKNLMSKFEARNAVHLVYLAQQKGFLSLKP